MPKTIRVWSRDIHSLAQTKGWWGETGHHSERPMSEAITNIHAEISEAWECYRAGEMAFTTADNGKPEGFWVEIADTIIRCLDLCDAYQVDIEHIMALKHEFNKSRPFRHGGKLA